MSTDQTLIKSIQKSFIDFGFRAEKSSSDTLAETFVDAAPLLDLLASRNSTIMYGRRGTGKTHALKYLEQFVESVGDVAIYLDMRSIGSNSSIYNDEKRSISDRATQLINDVLQSMLSSFYNLALVAIETAPHAAEITKRIDDYQAAISSVTVRGVVENETYSETNQSESVNAKMEASLSVDNPVSTSLNLSNASSKQQALTKKTAGIEALHVDFGSIQSALAGLIAVLGVNRLWLLIDEWSEVPLSLQPYLADLMRRTILPVDRCILKVAAIEHRSNFSLRYKKGEYIGLELGADISANLNLDDFLVFDADENRSVQFFKNLIFKHYSNSSQASKEITSADNMIQAVFTQKNVFAEFVRAIEGVPRDALSLAATVATKAFGSKISMNDVHTGARDWYQRDKASVLRGNPHLEDIMALIRDDVIGKRKARAFLFPNNIKSNVIEELFDARLLHILKKNISSKEEPGMRYDAFKIDYGCYVDLINTESAPVGLFEALEASEGEPADLKETFVEVPKDDYRSIRRAILAPELLSNLK